MKVICTGSRTWTDRRLIERVLSTYPPDTVIVHGKSLGGGADSIVDEVARELGFTVIPMPVTKIDYVTGHYRSAPIMRNIRMQAEHPDADVIEAFWDGKSSGTKHMIDLGRRKNITVNIHLEEQ